MLNKIRKVTITTSGIMVFFMVCFALSLRAQTAAVTTEEPKSGWRAEFLREMTGTEKKYLDLANAIPQEKYIWRPAEGVRSISEVLMHIAAANFNIPRNLGTPPPQGFNAATFEKSETDKAKISQILKDSFAHLRRAVLAINETDAEKTLKWFGGTENTYRGILYFITKHSAEHLGQTIVYARLNGITPLWTEEQQRRQQQQKK